MSSIGNVGDARFAATRNYPSAREFIEFTDDDGATLGWTFAATSRGTGFGWVLAADGRLSPATDTYRSDAEDYGRRTALDNPRPSGRP
ncbi:hypothetical protein ACF08W_28815 [Streptomyces sp. NPDC015144]|uniref:hypothetical protein n=1 Tax=Streptomyces sp. NPDC015144 TaxID=3364944 RepID=UPI0036FCE777